MEEAIILGAKRALSELGIRTVETPVPNLPVLSFAISSQRYLTDNYIDATNPILEKGNRNRVIWDGVPYDCETLFTPGPGGRTLVCVGNPIIYATDGIPVEDNGLPFTINLTTRSNGVITTGIYGEVGTHTLEIHNLVKATTPIDQKYLAKTVNLNDYTVGDSTLGMAILLAGMQGQKVVTPVSVPPQFFVDCDTENQLRFVNEATLDGGISIRQEFDGICKNYMNGQLSQISYSFVSWFNNTLFTGSVAILPGGIIANSTGIAASLG